MSAGGATPEERGRTLAVGLSLAVPAVFYFWTCSRTIGVTDSAILIEQMVKLDLSSHVSTHNLTVLLGNLFCRLPFGELAFRANLVSAVVGAVSVAAFTAVARNELRSAWWALLPGWLLMVSHSHWWHSTIAESYAINALLTVAAIHLLARFEEHRRQRDLLLLFGLAGLAFFNHVSMGILYVAAAVALLLDSWGDAGAFFRRLPRALAATALGLLPYGALFLRDLLREGSLEGVAREAVGGDFTGMMFHPVEGAVRGFFEWLLLQFPSFFLLLVPLGIWAAFARLRHRVAAAALLAAGVVNVVFFVQFATWDEFAFHLPVWVLLAWFGVLGLRSILAAAPDRAPRAALAAALATGLFVPPWLYSRLGHFPRLADLAIGWRFDNRPTENSYDWAEFLANPDKHRTRDVADFAEALLAALPPDALFFDDDGRSYGPLRYYQLRQNRRLDVRIELLNSWGFTDWGLDADAVVARAAEHPARVFVVSDGDFYAPLLARLAQDGYRSERFELGNGRWVFEVVAPLPRSDATLADPQLQVVRELPGTGYAADVTFERSERILAALSYRADSAVPIHCEWRDAAGELRYANDPGVAPPGAGQIFAELKLPAGSRARGAWEVSIWSRGQKATAATFSLE